MSDDTHDDTLHALERQCAALRAQHLARLAAEDPTLNRLAAALAEERRFAQMTVQEMAAFVQDLEARFAQQRKDAP